MIPPAEGQQKVIDQPQQDRIHDVPRLTEERVQVATLQFGPRKLICELATQHKFRK